MRAIFFDCDGVLTREYNGTGTICRNLQIALPSLDLDTLTAHFKHDCGHLLKTGGQFVDVWETFCGHIGQDIPPDILKTALQTVTPNVEMIALAQSLVGKYILGIITDNTRERMDLLRTTMSLDAMFRPIINSADVHALKHDGTSTIFDAALQATQCKPTEALFIDNQKRNLVTPAKMGMQTYWHDDQKNDMNALRKALERLGVEIH